jgi:hypothetical protein
MECEIEKIEIFIPSKYISHEVCETEVCSKKPARRDSLCDIVFSEKIPIARVADILIPLCTQAHSCVVKYKCVTHMFCRSGSLPAEKLFSGCWLVFDMRWGESRPLRLLRENT